MGDENLLPEDNEVPDYLERILQMMQPYTLENDNNFYPWLDQFEYVTDMIGVPDDKIIEIFINMIDDRIHRNFQIFVPFLNLSDTSYNLFINHYLYYFYRVEPSKVHKMRFKNRNQYEEEPLERYASNLQKIFERGNLRTEMDTKLNKRFIEGLKDDRLRTSVKKNVFLSFEETVKKVVLISRILNKYTCECLIVQVIDVYRDGNADLFFMWINRFEFVLDFHETPKEHMLEKFNELVDTNFQTYIKNCNEDINFSELSYEDTVNIYLRHYINPDEPNLHRRRFRYRVQYEHESTEGYAERLREIYNKCDFDDSLEEILSEQFVSGLWRQQIRNEFKRRTHLLFVDVISLAMKFEESAAIAPLEIPDLSIIDFFNSENASTFCDWFNKFEYTVKNLKLGNLTVLEVFNKKIHSDIQKKVKNANPNIEFSEISYEDTITLYLRYFASADETDVYRKLFLCRNQYEDEKIAEYADSLFDIFQNCNCNGNREKILIEKFINGLYVNEMKIIYRRFSNIKYQKLIKLAHNFGRFQKFNSHLSFENARLKSFHPDHGEEFYVWLNEFEYIADKLNLRSMKMIKLFNFMVHKDVQTLVKKANSEIEFTDLRSDELIDCYLRFYSSADDTDLHLKRFLCRNQYQRETLGDYFPLLRTIYRRCNTFELPKDILCERFREGVYDDNLKVYLNNSRGLTSIALLAKALVFANETSQS